LTALSRAAFPHEAENFSRNGAEEGFSEDSSRGQTVRFACGPYLSVNWNSGGKPPHST
jgi:hypothetical protein